MTILMLKSTILVQGYIRSMCKGGTKGKNTISSTFTMNNPIYIKNNGKQTLLIAFILPGSVHNP